MNLPNTVEDIYFRPRDLGQIEAVLIKRMPGPIVQASDLEGDRAGQALLMLFKSLLDMLRRRYGFTDQIRLCLVGAACPVQNACAFRAGGAYHIALPYELVSHLYFQAELVVVCEPFQTAFDLDPAVVQITGGNARTFPRINGLPAIEHTPLAMMLGRAFGEGMVLSVLLHELGHILNGHLGMMGGVGQALEEQAALDNPDLRVTRQTLEFDADCFAAVQTLDMFAHGYGIPPLLAPLCSSRDVATRIGVAVVNLMFRSFDTGGAWTPDALVTASSHPPARMRSALAREVLAAAVCRALGVTPESAALNYLLPPMLAIEESQLFISHETEWVSTLEAQSHDAALYLSRVLRRWARIRPRLTQYKIGSQGLAPASMDPD
ncbi:hypothetical protein [Phenylobacterium sp.]|uniref:hypothetical protein n=1 Tax=Phenylobacterium sp. TaxID=1871053 RepID=UPI00301BC925